MHPEIEEILNSANLDFLMPKVMLLNAERLLNYFDDINVERTGKFEPTPAESLYIVWNVEQLEFHIECLMNGNILYTFRKNGLGKATGCSNADQFMELLQQYLLVSI